jgi:exodeoxyribonuclease-3
MITLASWNINSIKARPDIATAWLDRVRPDLLLLQEIKCTTDTFPVDAFSALGYHAAVRGQPSYNGVAVLSRGEPVTVNADTLLQDDPMARFLDVTYRGVRAVNIYAPNGNPVQSEKFPYKLRWLHALDAYCHNLLEKREKFLIAGDFNIIPTEFDAKHPGHWRDDALFQPESRNIWKKMIFRGMTDAFRALNPHAADYTFWDYQAGAWGRNDGIRIDHVLLSPALADRLDSCWIDRDPRGGDKPSDHTPILVRLGL